MVATRLGTPNRLQVAYFGVDNLKVFAFGWRWMFAWEILMVQFAAILIVQAAFSVHNIFFEMLPETVGVPSFLRRRESKFKQHNYL